MIHDSRCSPAFAKFTVVVAVTFSYLKLSRAEDKRLMRVGHHIYHNQDPKMSMVVAVKGPVDSIKYHHPNTTQPRSPNTALALQSSIMSVEGIQHHDSNSAPSSSWEEVDQSSPMEKWEEIGHQLLVDVNKKLPGNANIFKPNDRKDMKSRTIGSREGLIFMNVSNPPEKNDDGKYEFQLQWWRFPKVGSPTTTVAPSLSIKWKQSWWLTEDQNIENVNLDDDTSCTYMRNWEQADITKSVAADRKSANNCRGACSGTQLFHGLARSSDSNHCLIDGNGARGNWWNCVGESYTGYYGGGMPCFDGKI